MTKRNSCDRVRYTPISVLGWGLVLLRSALLVVLVFGSLGVMLILRIMERPLLGLHRPVTSRITMFVCRNALQIIGIKYRMHGMPMGSAGAIVANHVSWLDIFCLNARKDVFFVSKAEVAKWPAIGLLARATGTIFIERNRTKAQEHTRLLEQRLLAGHRLLFFPEGTSTDGQQVLPFKTTLFQPFMSETLRSHMIIQSVTLKYTAPSGQDTRFYGWWGDTGFAPHFIRTLSVFRQGSVDVIYHRPVAVANFANRKQLATHLEDQVRSAYL